MGALKRCKGLKEVHVGPVHRGRKGAREWAVLANLWKVEGTWKQERKGKDKSVSKLCLVDGEKDVSGSGGRGFGNGMERMDVDADIGLNEKEAPSSSSSSSSISSPSLSILRLLSNRSNISTTSITSQISSSSISIRFDSSPFPTPSPSPDFLPPHYSKSNHPLFNNNNHNNNNKNNSIRSHHPLNQNQRHQAFIPIQNEYHTASELDFEEDSEEEEEEEEEISPYTLFTRMPPTQAFKGSTEGFVGTSMLFCDRYMTLDCLGIRRLLMEMDSCDVNEDLENEKRVGGGGEGSTKVWEEMWEGMLRRLKVLELGLGKDVGVGGGLEMMQVDGDGNDGLGMEREE
jgi:hypothetical protein